MPDKSKKNKSKKSKKRAKRTARKVDAWIEDGGVTSNELMLAGLGVMAQAVERKKKKMFKRALRRGERLLDSGIRVMPGREDPAREDDRPTPDEAAATSDSEERSEPQEPVIAYRPKGGGWFSVEVSGISVDSVQGEEAAAARAAELLQSYAALDPTAQSDTTTAVEHSGGGWYTVKVQGVPVERVRGRDEAERRFAELGVGAELV